MIPVEGIVCSFRHVQKDGPHSTHCMEAPDCFQKFPSIRPASGSHVQVPVPKASEDNGDWVCGERVICHVKEHTAHAAGKYFLLSLASEK